MKKKLIVGLICLIIAIIAIICTIFIVNSNNSTKSVAKALAKAMCSEKEMEKFAKKNIDFKTSYVLASMDVKSNDINDKDEMEKRIKEYLKDVSDDDVEEYKEEMINQLKGFVDEDTKLKLKKVNKKEEFEDSPVCDQVIVVYEDENKNEVKFTLIYYKDKLVMFYPMLNNISNLKVEAESATKKSEQEVTESVEIGESNEIQNTITDTDDDNKSSYTPKIVEEESKVGVLSTEEISKQEIEMYNAQIKKYVGDSVKGSEVKLLIMEIINHNSSNIGELGKFVAIDADRISSYDRSTSLVNLCNIAADDNNQSNVTEANKEMMNLRAKIGASKNYKITAKYEDGIIVGVTISENSK